MKCLPISELMEKKDVIDKERITLRNIVMSLSENGQNVLLIVLIRQSNFQVMDG